MQDLKCVQKIQVNTEIYVLSKFRSKVSSKMQTVILTNEKSDNNNGILNNQNFILLQQEHE